MLRKFLVASTAVAAISTLLFVSQSAEAGSCAVLSEKAIGLKKSETSARALKQLNRKAKHWAKKNGYKTVSLGKVATKCSGKGALNHCTSPPRRAATDPSRSRLAKAGDAIVT